MKAINQTRHPSRLNTLGESNLGVHGRKQEEFLCMLIPKVCII